MADYPAGSTILAVSSTTRMQIGDTVEVMLNNDELFTTTISGISGTQILINNPLPHAANAGNIVIDLTQSTNVAPVISSDIT